jgi:hypothetical protein
MREAAHVDRIKIRLGGKLRHRERGCVRVHDTCITTVTVEHERWEGRRRKAFRGGGSYRTWSGVPSLRSYSRVSALSSFSSVTAGSSARARRKRRMSEPWDTLTCSSRAESLDTMEAMVLRGGRG